MYHQQRALSFHGYNLQRHKSITHYSQKHNVVPIHHFAHEMQHRKEIKFTFLKNKEQTQRFHVAVLWEYVYKSERAIQFV